MNYETTKYISCFSLQAYKKHVQPGSSLHQATLGLSHKPKCVPNRLQPIGVAHESLDHFI